jgi:hypothetical protein
MRLSTMNVLRQCFDCAQYRYEVYCDTIDGSYFCDYCHEQRMKDCEGGEQWTATWERV